MIPNNCLPFLDDVRVKEPKSEYDGEEGLPGIRRFVMEHIQLLDKTLARIERAGCTIGPKSQFCIDGIRVVGFICGVEGRRPDSAKVIQDPRVEILLKHKGGTRFRQSVWIL